MCYVTPFFIPQPIVTPHNAWTPPPPSPHTHRPIFQYTTEVIKHYYKLTDCIWDEALWCNIFTIYIKMITGFVLE